MSIFAELLIIAFVIFIIVGIGTKGKFFLAVKGRLHAKAEELTEAVRDPIAESRLAISQAEEELEELRSDVINTRTELALLQKEKQAQVEAIDKYTKLAELAGNQNNEADVRAALTLRAGAQTLADRLNAQIVDLEAIISDYTTLINSRNTEIQDARTHAKTLVYSLRFQNHKQSIQASRQKHSTHNAALQRLRADVDKAEATNDAISATHAESSVGSAESLTAKYTTRPIVSDEEVAKFMVASSKEA